MAVTLSEKPSAESLRISGAEDSPLVLVIEILTYVVTVPTRNFARLPFHRAEIVGKYFERNWQIGYRSDRTSGEYLVVGESCLAHQRRISREAVDQTALPSIDHFRQLGAVLKKLNATLHSA